MTIFVDVLVKLIKDQLSHVSSNLIKQSKSWGWNHKLSLDQAAVIATLSDALTLFKSTDDDDADAKAIAVLLTTAREGVQGVREAAGEPRDEGKTMTCLNNLILHTPGFYNKLAKFDFNLLNKPSTNTPESRVFYHACCYFGEEIFEPKAHSDVEIRKKKEAALGGRLKIVSQLIKPTSTFDEQYEHTSQFLKDLDSDNRSIIKAGSSSGFKMPSITFAGLFQANPRNEWFAGPGRLNEQFKLATSEIEAMRAVVLEERLKAKEFEARKAKELEALKAKEKLADLAPPPAPVKAKDAEPDLASALPLPLAPKKAAVVAAVAEDDDDEEEDADVADRAASPAL